MRVLHLFSNWKWTGPAEPALNLCVALRQVGVDADFACAAGPGDVVNKVVKTARDRGVEPLLQFHLSKHLNPLWNWVDARRLRSYLARNRYDLVHVHLDNDHRIAVRALRGLGIPLVRSSYYGEGFPDKGAYRELLRATAVVVEPSMMAWERDEKVFGNSGCGFRVVPVGVDTARFDPRRDVPDARRWLKIESDAFVVGIVARMQRHRRFEDFFEAVRLLAASYPNVVVIVVGRGSRQQEVGFDPVRQLGLQRYVRFPGYVDGENYVGMLKAFDVQVMLVPGSDGTCRAVREGMAMGKPVVVARRGMLPEMVEHEKTGLVTDGSPKGLFEALRRLAEDRRYSRELGRNAREFAVREWSLGRQADRVFDVYKDLVGGVDLGACRS
ncbi:MAG TPA: glycosyltransferase family 4 protein [Candidatus Hydrogenedentes bacterium]|nr:glycosyltransferase family 4 protein [Candidatus Hydrogenedentota bacterium]HOL78204.1 glycosyltransferase family 4 protein [Candidatus Hydrogenedentota bacterium]HPO87219.1 glycosyltransferase family 4 protein [Candidatus Hydrogenedentota bacterium]